MDNYMKNLEDSMMREHLRIREEFLQMLERTLEENERRIKDVLQKQGNTEPPEFVNIRKRIAQVNAQIDRL
jgi:hypothetical protein